MTENGTETQETKAEPISTIDVIADAILGGGSKKSEDKPEEGEKDKDGSEEESKLDETVEDKDGATESKKEEKDETEDVPLEISQSDFNELIVSQYKEYGINDAGEVQQRLEDYPELEKENESLKKELDEARKAPKFEDDNQKKLFEYVKNFDGTNAEALADFAYLQSMDVSKLSDKEALLEWYIRSSDLSREESAVLFERSYNKKYTADEDDEQEKKLVKLEEKRDAISARKELASLKDATKLESKKAEEKQEPAPDKEFAEISGKYKKELDSSMKDFDSISFEQDFGMPVNYGLTKDQVAAIDRSIRGWIDNKTMYKDGQIIGGFDPEGLKVTMAMALYSNEIMDFVAKEYYKQGEIKVRKEYAGKKPDRKETTAAPTGSRPKSMYDAIEQGFMSKK